MGYSRISKILHWVLAVFILGLMAFGNQIANSEPSFELIAKYNQHKVAGLVALLLIIWRLVERLRTRPTPPGGDNPTWEDYLARIVHIAFYVALFAMPLSGWAASSASGQYPIIFGTPLPGIAPQDPELSKTLFKVHGAIGKILLGLLALHLVGLFKRLISGDMSPMQRMTG